MSLPTRHHSQQYTRPIPNQPRLASVDSPDLIIREYSRSTSSHSPQAKKSIPLNITSSSSSPSTTSITLPSTSSHTRSNATNPPPCLKYKLATTRQQSHVERLTRTVHFPPSPLGPVSHTFQTHSAATYDRTPIYSRRQSRSRDHRHEDARHGESSTSGCPRSCSRSSCKGDDDVPIAVAIYFLVVVLCLSILTSAWAF